MTEDIGSDKHKRPSSAEIEAAEKMAVMRERIAQSKVRDAEILSVLESIRAEQARQGTMLALGAQRFEALETRHDESSTRITALENDKRGPVAIIIATLSGIAAGATAWLK